MNNSALPKACAQPGELFVSAVPRERRARAEPSDEKRSAQNKRSSASSTTSKAWSASPLPRPRFSPVNTGVRAAFGGQGELVTSPPPPGNPEQGRGAAMQLLWLNAEC